MWPIRMVTVVCVLHATLSPLLGDDDSASRGPRFTRHVVPMFSRLGCNAGTCHGAVRGKNGFRLSLFGADPQADHAALVREFGGRRFNTVTPEESLLLLKATGTVAHQGGQRTRPGQPEYEVLRRWLAAGAVLDRPDDSRLAALVVTPSEQTLTIGQSVRLRVQATFADGASEDVTAACLFESRQKLVATVDAAGEVRAVGAGDVAMIVRYRGQPALAQVLVPLTGKPGLFSATEHNFIDRHVLARLQRMNLPSSGLCDDATFLRRVSLDVAGTLPTPDEVRAFLADVRPDKRARKVNELLDRPGYSALWSTWFCDLLRPGGFQQNAGQIEAAETRRFYDWLRDRLQENTPYDQMAERILTATSREGRPLKAWSQEVVGLVEENARKTSEVRAYMGRQSLDLYWQRTNDTAVKRAMRFGHAFLGLRLECAQCHRHPNDVWQQDDLLSFANFFSRIGPTTNNAELADEVKRLMTEAEKLKTDAKPLGEKAKEKDVPKDEADKLKQQAKELSDRAKVFEDAAKRIKGTEVSVLEKGTFASVSSTLGTQKSETFRLLGASQPVTIAAGADPRAIVATWLRSEDNPFFARAIVNRVWNHYLGRGIIDPPDHLSPLNPPTHPELLRELCDDFIRHGYDLKHLHRTITASRTYQQSVTPVGTNRHDTTNYALFAIRRLPAEVLVDAVNHATGSRETFPPEMFIAANATAVEVPVIVSGEGKPRVAVEYALKVFGRPSRLPEVQCDCERGDSPTMAQTMYLANHPQIRDKIARADGRVSQLLKGDFDDARRIEELYLWTVSRLPSDDERQACLAYVKASPSPQRGLEDVLWSLLNTREFVLQH